MMVFLLFLPLLAGHYQAPGGRLFYYRALATSPGEVLRRRKFSLRKCIKCPSTPLRRNSKQSPVNLDLFEENSGRQITWLSWRHRFRKAPFSKCYPSTRKRKPGVCKFLQLKVRFRKAFFFCKGLVWMVGVTRRREKKLRFQISRA